MKRNYPDEIRKSRFTLAQLLRTQLKERRRASTSEEYAFLSGYMRGMCHYHYAATQWIRQNTNN